MTPLRQRMLDAMTVRSLAERTNECYTEAVARLAPPTRSPEFLFPVTALSTVFRGKFMAALQAAHEYGEIANDPQDGKRTVKFDGVEFVRRFLLHVLPTGLKRIRHYGLLAPGKAQSLAHAREQMQMPQSNPVALVELARDFIRRVAQVDLY